MDDENEPKERIDVWLTAADLESLNLIRYKHGGATKAAAMRVCIRLARLWIEGKLPKPLP